MNPEEIEDKIQVYVANLSSKNTDFTSEIGEIGRETVFL